MAAALRKRIARCASWKRSCAEMPEVQSYFSNLGHGNPKIYYNELGNEGDSNYGDIFVKLKHYDTSDTPRLLDRSASGAQAIPERAHLREGIPERPADHRADRDPRRRAGARSAVSRWPAQVEKIIKETPGTRDVENPVRMRRTNLQLDVDSHKAALLGVPTVEFDRAVRLAVAGIPAGRYKDSDGEQYDIMVRTPIAARPDVRALDQVRVVHADRRDAAAQPARARRIQLRADADRSLQPRARRHDQRRSAARLQHRRVTTTCCSGSIRCSGRAAIPMSPAASSRRATRVSAACRPQCIVALLGIIAVLVLEFGSFKSTLIVLSVVPFGIAGGILALGADRQHDLVHGDDRLHRADRHRDQELDPARRLHQSVCAQRACRSIEAIERAGEIRFLPILLTSATAIGGLLPLAVQNAGMYSPLAWVIIGGLVSSTLVARVVTPVMYKLIPPSIEVEAEARAQRRRRLRLGTLLRRLSEVHSNPLALPWRRGRVFFARRFRSARFHPDALARVQYSDHWAGHRADEHEDRNRRHPRRQRRRRCNG